MPQSGSHGMARTCSGTSRRTPPCPLSTLNLGATERLRVVRRVGGRGVAGMARAAAQAREVALRLDAQVTTVPRRIGSWTTPPFDLQLLRIHNSSSARSSQCSDSTQVTGTAVGDLSIGRVIRLLLRASAAYDRESAGKQRKACNRGGRVDLGRRNSADGAGGRRCVGNRAD